ncbi:MAG: hypothetical protein WBN94_06620 [Methanothrix sp.]
MMWNYHAAESRWPGLSSRSGPGYLGGLLDWQNQVEQNGRNARAPGIRGALHKLLP